MIVMKFGGTSLEDAASVERVSEIIRARLSHQPLVVVSAMGKTTRTLLDAAEASAAGDTRATLTFIADLKSRHVVEAEALVKNRNDRRVFDLIEAYFEELKKLLEGLAILGEVPPRGLDKILSYGELLSSAIVADALVERGLPATLLDSRDFIKTDEQFGNAQPLIDLTNKLISEKVAPLISAGKVPVIQGFIGSTRQGAATTLGFEGSDYTATIVGSALEAKDIQIWKDVSGLMTADPRVHAGARTVKLCSYGEAAELTFFGAKVLHPKAIYPAREKNIPVHIYNSKQPEAAGTEITSGAIECQNLIKSIAYKRPVSLIHISRADDYGLQRANRLSELLDRHGVPQLLRAASGSNMVVAVDSDRWNQQSGLFRGDPEAGGVEPITGKGIVTIVGNELRSDRTGVALVFNAIRGIDVDLILHGSSPIAMHFVVAENDVAEVISRLHRAFFERLDQNVFE